MVMERILIVDDEENARIGLTKLLANDGYQVEAVANGFEALEYLRKKTVDLVITDINMPKMNGLVFLRELNISCPTVNVIMITTYGGVVTYLKAMNLGAFEYLKKPFNLDELKAIISGIFNRQTNQTNQLIESVVVS
jgi:DNA-binding NtrC family response regulator